MWRCLSCHVTKRKQDLKRHIEARHLQGTGVACPACQRSFKNSDSLRHHTTVCMGGYRQ